jgi:hypothetical protein
MVHYGVRYASFQQPTYRVTTKPWFSPNIWQSSGWMISKDAGSAVIPTTFTPGRVLLRIQVFVPGRLDLGFVRYTPAECVRDGRLSGIGNSFTPAILPCCRNYPIFGLFKGRTQDIIIKRLHHAKSEIRVLFLRQYGLRYWRKIFQVDVEGVYI